MSTTTQPSPTGPARGRNLGRNLGQVGRRVWHRSQEAALRGVLGLPRPLQRRLAGPPVTRDGLTLSLETQVILRLQQITREPVVERLPIPQGRIALGNQTALVGGRIPIASRRDLTVTGADGSLPARLYTPRSRVGDTASPLLVFLHGGGMIYGDLDSHDGPCRFLANRAGVRVLAVDYRLAPEHPFPAAVEDCAAAYTWAVENADVLGTDPRRYAVGGDSAGGYLAATTAIHAAQHGLPLAFQLLIYPVTDFVEEQPSRALFSRGFYLTREFMDLAEHSYFRPGDDQADPRASVLRADLDEVAAHLAPAFVATAGFDPLRDEGEGYADRLAAAGVRVGRERFPDLIHGFLNVCGVGTDTMAANEAIAARLEQALRIG